MFALGANKERGGLEAREQDEIKKAWELRNGGTQMVGLGWSVKEKKKG